MSTPPNLMARLGASVAIIAAPMAGGPSSIELVTAVGRAGGIGFLAAGYKGLAAIEEQIRSVRAAGVTFGVNLFAPNHVQVDLAAFRAYAARLAPDAARFGIDLSDAEPVEDDDLWAAKIDLLIAEPVPLVSFTFGLPKASVISALQKAGTAVVLTVTSAHEAAAAAELRPDALAVQSTDAGGHSGTLTPQRPPAAISLTDLLGAVRSVTDLPLIGAGGVGTAAHVAAAMRAGASAVAVGTLLLRTDESAASDLHKDALADPARTGTVVTRAFTGRPARALVNEFTDRHSAAAPLGYPALHHLSSPMRKAATAAHDPEWVNLWAGTAHRQASTGPAGDVVVGLASAI